MICDQCLTSYSDADIRRKGWEGDILRAGKCLSCHMGGYYTGYLISENMTVAEYARRQRKWVEKFREEVRQLENEIEVSNE